MNTYEELRKYVNGSKLAYELLSDVTKNMIKLAVELFAFGLFLAMYSDLKMSSIITFSILFVVTIIIGLILYKRYTTLHNAFIDKCQHTVNDPNIHDKEELLEREQCLENSKTIVTTGLLATIVNAMTIGLSLVLIIIAFVTLFKK